MSDEQIAEPRTHVNTKVTEPYRPDWGYQRPGSTDALALPSIINNNRIYRRDAVASNTQGLYLHRDDSHPAETVGKEVAQEGGEL